MKIVAPRERKMPGYPSHDVRGRGTVDITTQQKTTMQCMERPYGLD